MRLLLLAWWSQGVRLESAPVREHAGSSPYHEFFEDYAEVLQDFGYGKEHAEKQVGDSFFDDHGVLMPGGAEAPPKTPVEDGKTVQTHAEARVSSPRQCDSEVPEHCPTGPGEAPGPEKLDMELLRRLGLSSENVRYDVGSRMFRMMQDCAGEELRVAVYISFTEVVCVPFTDVVTGAELALVKLASTNGTKAVGRLLRNLGNADSRRDAARQVRANWRRGLGGFKQRHPGWFSRWLPDTATEDNAPTMLHSRREAGLVIQEIRAGRAERFYRDAVHAASVGLAGRHAPVELTVEYLAELGRSAPAVDMALFGDFTAELVAGAVELAMGANGEPQEVKLEDVYRWYCDRNPAGPVGTAQPGPVELCLLHTRSAHALAMFAFGVLDPFAQVVASTFGPVCGTATESVGLRRQDEVEGAPLCDRAPRDGLCIPAEESWCFAPKDRHWLSPCCCGFDSVEMSVSAQTMSSGMMAGAYPEHNPFDPTSLEAVLSEKEYATRTAGRALPVKTCSASRLVALNTMALRSFPDR